MEKSLVTSSMMIDRNGEEQEITIDGYVLYYNDRAYGADADGNRGIEKTIIKDIIDITGWNDSMASITLSALEIEKASEILAETFFEEGR